MNRVSIIGGSGTGKTTLADNLGKQWNLPVYHIDGIHHLKNWEVRDKDERDQIILDIVNKDKWLMDGTYTSTLEQRLKHSDYIIYLDYSSLAQIKGILGRYLKNPGKERKEIPGCKEQLTWKFFWWVARWRRLKRKDIVNEVSKIDSKKVHVFKSRKELNKWYETEFNEKITV